MRKTSILLAIASALLLFALPVKAQEVASLFDVDKRLSVGARAYRSFEETPGLAGSYSSGWWAGLSSAYEITSPRDPRVKLPISLIGSLDVGVPGKRVRGYVGIGLLLKRAVR